MSANMTVHIFKCKSHSNHLRVGDNVRGVGDFKSRLVQVREEAGLTQAELAEAAGLDQSTLSTWETGRAKRVGDVAERLAAVSDATQCDLRYLLTGAVATARRTASNPRPNLSAAVSFARLCGFNESAIEAVTKAASLQPDDRAPYTWFRMIVALNEDDGVPHRPAVRQLER